MRTARHQQCKEEIALSTDRKTRPPDCFLHLAAQQRQNICSRRLFHQSAVAERSAELLTDFAFTTDESIQGALSLCRDPSANADAEDLVAPERAQVFHLISKRRLSSERYSRLRLLAGETPTENRNFTILRGEVPRQRPQNIPSFSRI